MGTRELTATKFRASPTSARSPDAASLFRDALIDLCYERGFASVTIGDLCRRAGVGPAAFRRRYAGLEDCFFQVCRAELARFRHQARIARLGLGDWRARLRATIYALYRFLDEDDRLRHFALLEARTAGERPALLLGVELEALYDLIDEGRGEPGAPLSLTRTTAESLGGGLFTEIYLAAGHEGPLPPETEFVPAIMYAAVLPYLGAAAAVEELHVPPPSPPASAEA
jgi:AcrR family transcriptional regulator